MHGISSPLPMDSEKPCVKSRGMTMISRLKKTPVMAAFCGLLIITGCAVPPQSEEPDFSDDKVPAVRSPSEFDQVLSDSASNKGQAIKLAGRVDRIESTDEGYKVTANWLPYPPARRIDQGPKDVQMKESRRFLIFFRGKVKSRPFYLVRGNRFVMEGTIGGTQRAVVDIFGTQSDLLYVHADCVRVWETGIAGGGTEPDSQYPDAVARTFCTKR